ncbi:putative O-methyltransferase family 3 [Rhodospirillaceae bacterium LM-1]|nr:putative O-methyltransferase family 3 [Rhodospirillaceae bacterium LM-1]
MTQLEVVLSVCIIVLLITSVSLASYVIRVRNRAKQRSTFGPWPIPKLRPSEIDPAFTPGPYGPNLDCEVHHIANIEVRSGVSDLEQWILAVLSKKSLSMFEFGTCTGRTTYLWARNSAPEARITTLTLAPDQLAAYVKEAGDEEDVTHDALTETIYSSFLYSGTSVEAKITQLFGDSKSFDETPYIKSCDLIFVDGSHAYSYVKSDTAKALSMIKPGGLVVWHDYRGPRKQKGVWRALNELARTHPLRHVGGTSLVIYRAPE